MSPHSLPASSPILLFQPSPSEALLSRGLPYLLLHSVAKVISLVSLSLLSSFLHLQKQSVSHPVPPPAFHLLSSKPLDQGDSFLLHMCDVSESASGQWSHANSHPAGFFPWQQHYASILVPQQGYPGNRLQILRSLGSVAEEVGGKSLRWHHIAWLSSGGFQ